MVPLPARAAFTLLSLLARPPCLHATKNEFQNSGPDCKTSFSSCDLCASTTHHMGCHSELSHFSASDLNFVHLTNDDCVAAQSTTLVDDGGSKHGYGTGLSMCWDERFHGSRDGNLCGSNPYSDDSAIPLVAKHACGALSSLDPTTCGLRQRPARALRIAAMDNPELTRSSPMLTAFNRMTATGFRTGPWLLTKETLSGKKPLTLPDFELAFTMWKRLEEDVQSLLSVHFVKYWQSIEGAALTGDVLRKLKALWEHTSPTQSRRLSPARACGLGWTAEETVALLETHVDLNGDTQAGPAPLPPWRYRPLTVLLWTA